MRVDRAEVAPLTALQVNVAPGDLPTVAHTIPHQLRAWAGQVDEIVYAVDTRRPRRSRAARTWERRRRALCDLLADVCRRHPHARVVPVDYGAAVAARLARDYAGGARIPLRSYAGRPVHGYLHGLSATRARYVLHLDCDMLFGGGSERWLEEAVALLRARPEVLTCSPLPGPPRADGRLAQPAVRDPWPGLAYRFDHVSTRVLLLDVERLRERVLPLRRARVANRAAVHAALHGRWPNLSLEGMLTAAMRRARLCRVDLLGAEPGMWSLHPPYRSERFYRELPSIVAAVEAGAVPDAQRGDYDLNDSMIDWSDGVRIGGPDDNYRRRTVD